MRDECLCNVLPYGAPRCLLGSVRELATLQNHHEMPRGEAEGVPIPPAVRPAGTPEEGQPGLQMCSAGSRAAQGTCVGV